MTRLRRERRAFLEQMSQASLLSCLFPHLLSQEATANSTTLFSQPGIPTQKRGLRVGFGSCFDVNQGFSVWRRVLEQRPDVWLSIGDNVYTRDGNMRLLERNYETLRQNSDFRQLQRETQFLATWDDHDYGINNGGEDFRHKNLSQQLFYDFVGVSKGSPFRRQNGVQFASSRQIDGRRVRFILFDLRSQKDASGRNDYLLSEAQWNWFADELFRPSDLTVVVSSIQVIPSQHRFEKWANAPTEKDRLYALLSSAQAGPVLLLSGDRHFHEVSSEVLYSGRVLNELTSSGLNRGTPDRELPQEENRFRRWRGGGSGFCLFDISFTVDGTPEVMVRFLDTDGQLQNQLALAFDVNSAETPLSF